MALQILPAQNKTLEVLEELSHNRLRNIHARDQQKQQQNELAQTLQGLNVHPQDASYLATLPPKQQLEALRLLGQGMSAQDMLPNTGLGQPQQPRLLSSLKQQTSGLSKEELKDRIKGNRTFLSESRNAYNKASLVEDKAKKLLRLLETGKVATGLKGYGLTKIPGLATQANTETRQFITESNDLVDALAATGGLPTKFRLTLKQESKPNVSQDRQTQMETTKDILEAAEKAKRPYELAQKQSKLGGHGVNLEESVFESIQAREGLPSASEYSDGSIYENNGVFFRKKKNQWEELPDKEQELLAKQYLEEQP